MSGQSRTHTKPRGGVCRVCGCTDEMGCVEGCGWANGEHTLCTSLTCQLVTALADVVDVTPLGPTLERRIRRLLRRARAAARW